MPNIRIDTSSLTSTQFLIAELNLELPLEGAGAPIISLEPGIHSFQQIPGLIGNFRFEVTADGLIDYDIANEKFLDGRGTSTLTVQGFKVTLDGRQLSHAVGLFALGIEPPQDRIQEVTLLPAPGYQFVLPSGQLADFRFDLDVNGQILFDPRFAGFAEVTDRKLTLNGYQVTIDVRLSHALGLFALGIDLPGNSTRELNLLPAAGYRFNLPSGQMADFEFDVDIKGQILFDPRFADLAEVSGHRLTIHAVLMGPLFAYAANGADGNVSGYTINPTTGALTAIAGSPFEAGRFPAGKGEPAMGVSAPVMGSIVYPETLRSLLFAT